MERDTSRLVTTANTKKICAAAQILSKYFLICHLLGACICGEQHCTGLRKHHRIEASAEERQGRHSKDMRSSTRLQEMVLTCHLLDACTFSEQHATAPCCGACLDFCKPAAVERLGCFECPIDRARIFLNPSSACHVVACATLTSPGY